MSSIDERIAVNEHLAETFLGRKLLTAEQELELDREATARLLLASALSKTASKPVENPFSSIVIEQTLAQLITRGMTLVNDGEPQEARTVFRRAWKKAEKLNDVLNLAKARRGLALAYRGLVDMRPAAGDTFEAAAGLFFSSGDGPLGIICLKEASDEYEYVNRHDKAELCLNRLDFIAREAEQQLNVTR